MKHTFLHCLGASLLSAILTTSLGAGQADPGFVDFGKLPAAVSGGPFVEVNIGAGLLAMAARLGEKHEPQLAEVLRGLHGIRVHVIGLDDGNRAEVQKRVQTLRAELASQGWDRVVTVQEKNVDVGVQIKTRGADAVQGLVVTVLEGNSKAVLVNILGDMKPENLSLIGERFHLEPLKKFGSGLTR
jgi:hypothetical protein